MLKVATILGGSDIPQYSPFGSMKRAVKHMLSIHLQVTEACCAALPNSVHSIDSFVSLMHC